MYNTLGQNTAQGPEPAFASTQFGLQRPQRNIKGSGSTKHANYATNMTLWEREEKAQKLWLVQDVLTTKVENVPIYGLWKKKCFPPLMYKMALSKKYVNTRYQRIPVSHNLGLNYHLRVVCLRTPAKMLFTTMHVQTQSMQ